MRGSIAQRKVFLKERSEWRNVARKERNGWLYIGVRIVAIVEKNNTKKIKNTRWGWLSLHKKNHKAFKS